jgi:hypothetical protein
LCVGVCVWGAGVKIKVKVKERQMKWFYCTVTNHEKSYGKYEKKN